MASPIPCSPTNKFEQARACKACTPMKFTQALFSCFKRATPFTPPPAFPPITHFMGAGCVFTDGRHVLAGYQPNKKRPCITGIGGHREGEEPYYFTAFRETIEEMYHCTEVPSPLLELLTTKLVPRSVQVQKGYVMLFYTLDDFHAFLKICKKQKIKSPLYEKMPKTLMNSILTRLFLPDAEISALCLLPVVKDHRKPSNFVHHSFLEDMKKM